MRPPSRFDGATFASYEAETPSQERAEKAVQALCGTVRRRRRWHHRMRKRLLGIEADHTAGLYLVGPVGTGKTHLLAAAYHELAPEIPCTFMHSAALSRRTETPEELARSIAKQAALFCLDEMEIDDPANEVRLVRLLQTLAEEGVTLLASSNVEPDAFLSARFGTHRFQRFLDEEFSERYEVLTVRGADYRKRLAKPGRAFIGTRPTTDTRLDRIAEETTAEMLDLEHEELMRRSRETRHERLVENLLAPDVLILRGVNPADAEESLRLLRLIDDLYFADAPPTLYFSSERRPEEWLAEQRTGNALEREYREKFERTTSRLEALCEVVQADSRAA